MGEVGGRDGEESLAVCLSCHILCVSVQGDLELQLSKRRLGEKSPGEEEQQLQSLIKLIVKQATKRAAIKAAANAALQRPPVIAIGGRTRSAHTHIPPRDSQERNKERTASIRVC